MKSIDQLLVVFICSLFLSAVGWGQVNDDEIQIPNRENSTEQQEKPYVILISIDGFRKDYIEKFDFPFLKAIQQKAVVAESMIPSYPSVTFSNHYTLVTGMIPPHHGIIGNRMYDPTTKAYYSLGDPKAVKESSWYGGVPIWSLAEKQGLLTACYYWPGSEAKIAGHYPSYYFPYAENKPISERIQKIKEWLTLPKETRPHLITFYMPQVDQAGHRFGTDALETEFAAKFVDQSMQQLVEAIAETKLPVNFIFLSDHGMIDIDKEHPIQLPKLTKEEGVTISSGVYANYYIKDKSKVDSLYTAYQAETDHPYQVYKKENVPETYKFSAKEDTYNRIGDLVFIAESPFYFTASPYLGPTATHGYHPKDTPEMQTVFMAWGPHIQKHHKINSFKNIHIYPLLTELLQLDYHHQIDGDQRLVPQVLK